MGGIGKTTIARAVYDKINHHFEGRCFLENVKQRFPSTDAGEAPLDMQAEILSSITNMKVGSSEILRNGFQKMMERVEYIDLSGHFIKYAQGLPLALKVLGAFLDNKSVLVWKDELKKIARNPHLGIQKVLRTSFDGLDGLQKEIFLDIACFFKQMKKDFAIRIMEGCDLHPHTGLDVLVGRALVTISSDDVLEMHDLLQELGHEIPLGKLKIINLKGSYRLKETPDFAEANNLEKLILGGCTSLCEVHPSISALEKLVLLDLSWCGKLKSFSRNICMKSLETFDLSFCSKLEKFPEISEVMEKLSKLYLQGTAIKELPRSINNLTGLVTLNLEYCGKLEILPSSIVQLKSLQLLNLSGCPKLKAFPENVGNMERLRELRLDETSVKVLALSISSLQNLEILSLKECNKLHSLPSSIHMRSLRTLNLSSCSNLYNFAEIPEVMNLLELNLDETAISQLPSSIKNFTGLVTLSLKDCRRLKILPGSIHMRSLQALNSLPAEKILSFQGLQLKNLSLNLKNCKSLVYLPDSICNLLSLEWLTLNGCSKLSKLPEDLRYLKRLDIKETGLDGYRPEQQFINLGDVAQFRSTEPKLNVIETGLDGYRPEQQFINLGDVAQFRSTEPKLNVIVPNMENFHEAVADVEERQDIAESSYLRGKEAVAASRRGGRIRGLCGSRGNGD
ncbi:protein suppressor of npr1-1 [Pyrus ussuriensis x Pyrus communis]|uniref:Protein suppressor of npr1-1 n=1 Tax=Pyrus ussuriensis x Pyrus communis TaxID=2448454 RepID=A0A5N5HH78_9ROSA|nr:protein suppressor of npr1-1 [Pyrus ussuriensis x Pyrus communis]